MPTREEIIDDKTFKKEGFELEKRIYYTLTQNEKLQADKVVKALSLLIKTLHQKEIVSDEDVDALLFECVC